MRVRSEVSTRVSWDSLGGGDFVHIVIFFGHTFGMCSPAVLGLITITIVIDYN